MRREFDSRHLGGDGKYIKSLNELGIYCLELMKELIMEADINNEGQFTEFVLNGKTVKDLEVFYNCSRSKIYSYKRKYDLIGKTPNSHRQETEDGLKTCKSCKTEKPLMDFYSNGRLSSGMRKYKPNCKVCEIEKNSINKQKKIETIINEHGREYKCELCGYDTNYAALEFHHIDTTTKDFSKGDISQTASLDNIRTMLKYELPKCAILCANCHREFHNPLSNKLRG